VKKLLPIPLLLIVLAVPEAVQSQEDAEAAPPTIVLSHFKCDYSRIADIISEAELQLPYWQQQKDAGNIWDTGLYVHAWADEWNVGRFMVAPSMESAVAANAAAGQAFAADHPDSNALGEACPSHRDNFYLGGPSADAEGAAEGGTPTLVLSFYQCETPRIGEVLAEYEEFSVPVYEQLIQAGKLRGAGSFGHSWADEWNVGFFFVAESIQTFVDAWEESLTMFPEDATNVIGEACPAHKDAFYALGPRTGG
jgi:hypothetical protein